MPLVSVTSISYNKEIMTTSQDILSFLKADKEARAQEKEKEMRQEFRRKKRKMRQELRRGKRTWPKLLK